MFESAFCAVCVELKLFHVQVNLRFQSQITQFVNSGEKKKTFSSVGDFFLIIILHIKLKKKCLGSLLLSL